MKIIDNIIILLLIVLSFYCGKKLADNYLREKVQELEYQLRVMAAEKGVGYVAQPVRRQRAPIGQPFMDKLHENGRAVQQLSSSHNT